MNSRRELDNYRGSMSIAPGLCANRSSMGIDYSTTDGKTKP